MILGILTVEKYGFVHNFVKICKKLAKMSVKKDVLSQKHTTFTHFLPQRICQKRMIQLPLKLK